MNVKVLPNNLKLIKKTAKNILDGIQSVKPCNFHFKSNTKRTDAGRSLADYYLVYFLLVELLHFDYLGPEEKVSWIIPIEYKKHHFTIEHRKMGLGIFCEQFEHHEIFAQEIANKINKAVEKAHKFYDWIAVEAISHSLMNIHNISAEGYGRYKYFINVYHSTVQNAKKMESQKKFNESRQLHQEAKWLTISCVDAFFSWTEHVFVLMAALLSYTKTSNEVVDLINNNWGIKFKKIFDITKDNTAKEYYEQLLAIRSEMRNYQTHGAFGKQGEAFQFHSEAGAVPVFLPYNAGKKKYSIVGGKGNIYYNSEEVLKVIENFITYLWGDWRSPCYIYIQENNLPIILTFSSDGTYSKALTSDNEMREFVEYLTMTFDRSADMDW